MGNSKDSGVPTNLIREISNMRLLSGVPGVVAMEGTVRGGGEIYIVMEVGCCDLERVIRGGLGRREGWRVVRDVVEAMRGMRR